MNRMLILWSALVCTASAAEWTLDQVLEAAHSQSLILESTKSKLAEANAKIAEAQSALEPKVSLSAHAAYLTVNPAANFPPMDKFPIPAITSAPFNSEDMRVGMRWSVLDLAMVDRYQNFKRSAQVQAMDTLVQKDQLNWWCTLSFMQVAKAQSIQKVRQDEKKLAEELYHLTLGLRQSGVSTKVDEIRSQGQLVSAQYNLSQVDYLLQKSQIELAQWINVDQAQDIKVKWEFKRNLYKDLSADSLLKLALVQRPEFAQIKQQLELSHREIKSIQKENLPTLDFGADLGLSGNELWSNGKPTWTTSLALNWGFWDGGRRSARIVQQKEKIQQMSLYEQDLLRKLKNEVALALAQVKQSELNLNLALQRKNLALDEMYAAKERFKLGASTSIELVQSQQGVALSDEQYVDAEIQVQLAQLNLQKLISKW